MKVLIFISVISTLNLVFADDKAAIDTSTTYKVHPDPEDVQDDQIAESSHPVRHGVAIAHHQETPKRSQNRFQVTDVRLDAQNVAQQGVHVQESLRHNSEVAQPDLSQMYEHPIYVQQYPIQPIRIIGAEASALQQVREGQNAYGYSTYVEHVSSKDEEEIQSALKEGSVGDIKRVVPKSGISFKIYHDKSPNLNVEKHKTEIHSNVLPSSTPEYSALHYKAEVPATQLRIQTLEHQQPTIIGLEHTYTKTGLEEQQHGLDNSQELLQTVGKTDQQSVNGQAVYITHPVADSQKAFSEAHEEASVRVRPNYRINLEGKTHGRATSTAEFNSLTASKGYGQGLGDLGHPQYQKLWSLESKLEGGQQATKNVKPFATQTTQLQYEIDPLAQAERSKGLQYTQSQPTSYVVHNNYNKHKSIGENVKNANYLSNSYVAKAASGQQANRVYDRKLTSNRLPGNHLSSETVRTGQNYIVSHVGTNGDGNSQHFKGSQSDYYATNSYSDSEPAKSSQQNFIGHVAKNTYVETKNSQNNFDHQKALEGSTSFDIKNAIDATGSLIHQTGSTTEAQHLEGIQKQQVAYVVPKIPTSTVLLDNAVHGILEGSHQVKEFGGISSPQFSYHAISSPEVSGKFVHQPQTIVWSSEHPKQGDLHHSIIRLNLPRDEIYQHLKAQNVELPSSTINHISYPARKPYVLHYDVPVVKYPQEIHFQPKTKTGIHSSQSNHIKLTQPVTIDWSLLKSSMPNFDLNSLALKSELTHIQETGKKIVPILVRKRKNRSNNKDIGVIYGKVNNNRRPSKPNHRQEKNVRFNLLPEASNTVKQFEGKGERKNEFSVSASYKVDRSFKSPNSS